MAGLSSRHRWARASIGARSLLAALLAVGGAVLAVDVADWRFWRVDLSASGRNTLDPAVLDVLDQLPEPVVVDVFFRELLRPYDRVSREAQNRMLELLAVAANDRRDKLEVRTHDPARFELARERQRELGIEGENLVAFSCGERRAELTLFGDIAVVDWGNPPPQHLPYLASQGISGVVDPRQYPLEGSQRMPQLSEFRGEEAFVQSLLKVSAEGAPRVYFARGHGEPDLAGSLPGDLAALRSALVRDGFEVLEWDPVGSPAVPSECEVLALIGARGPYEPEAARAVEEYLARGGRALFAPALSELEQGLAGGIVDLLRPLGIVARPGIVCQPVVGPSGEKLERMTECGLLLIGEHGLTSGHPLTEALRRRDRRIRFRECASFDESRQTESGLVLSLVYAPPDSWRDLPDEDGQYDYFCDPRRGEKRGRATLVSAKELRVPDPAGSPGSPASPTSRGGAVERGRVLAVASAFFFGNQDFSWNRDFALNAFNWLAERDYRVSVSPLKRGESFLDLERGHARPVLTYVLLGALPGACALVGAVVFLRRRS